MLPALGRRLLGLQAAQALCARTGSSGQRFELPCVIAQLQLLTGSPSPAQYRGPTSSSSSGLHTLTAGPSAPNGWSIGARWLHTSSASAATGRGLDFIVSSGERQTHTGLVAQLKECTTAMVWPDTDTAQAKVESALLAQAPTAGSPVRNRLHSLSCVNSSWTPRSVML